MKLPKLLLASAAALASDIAQINHAAESSATCPSVLPAGCGA